MTDLDLLARIIKCEAGGEGEIGMKAVATVIMNRVRQNLGEYGLYNDIPNVIYAPGQFDCAREYIRGEYNSQNIYNIPADQEHYDIAQWAVDGNKIGILDQALWYFNPFGPECREQFPNANGQFLIRIGDHCFYAPTESYYLT